MEADDNSLRNVDSISVQNGQKGIDVVVFSLADKFTTSIEEIDGKLVDYCENFDDLKEIVSNIENCQIDLNSMELILRFPNPAKKGRWIELSRYTLSHAQKKKND